MKRIFYLPMFMAVLAFTGCAADSANLDPVEDPAAINPSVLALIEGMGFQTNDIHVTDDAYIVEGDIMIHKDYLGELKNESQTRQNYYGDSYIVNRNTFNRKKPIKIAVVDYPSNSSFYIAMNLYKTQLAAAIKEFNDFTGFDILLESVAYTSGTYHILIQNGNLDSKAMSAAYIPYNGNPGNTIFINADDNRFDGRWTSSGANPRVSDSKIKASLVHAIGHCLGLAHTAGAGQITNFTENESATSYQISGTPYSDGASIMNPQEHDYDYINATTLCSNDKNALAILYPVFSGGSIAPTHQTIVPGATPSSLTNVTLPVGASGTITYKWERNIPGNSS